MSMVLAKETDRTILHYEELKNEVGEIDTNTYKILTNMINNKDNLIKTLEKTKK